MARQRGRKKPSSRTAANRTSSPVDELLLAVLERGNDSFETGRNLVTFKEGASEEGIQSLGVQGMQVVDARDFEGQAATLEDMGDADALVYPEIGVALVGGSAAKERGLNLQAEIARDSPIAAIEPEYFVFAESGFTQPVESIPGGYLTNFTPTARGRSGEYLRGFLRAVETIARDLRECAQPQIEAGEEGLVLDVTWGLSACKVPPSGRSGSGIKVAALGTGLDLGHPDFVGRVIVSQTFVGQPVQDLNGHNTHLIGTAYGPKAPAGNIQRYGIGFRASIFVGKVLSNSGSGTAGSILAGINWAIANRCEVIFTAASMQSPPQAAYTAAGQAALHNGCLMIASAGSAASSTAAPANSPTIMSVASLDLNLAPSAFSNFGKIEIAAPGRDVFSSWARPTRYQTISGTSTAAAHVAGCAALWAETSPNLRGMTLWRKLQATARRLPFPAAQVGAGAIQAP